MTEETNFEVIIIGGSYAGLSAAMALGRSLRKVLIIDAGKPCNMQTPSSHNFITQDGEAPSEISRKAKEQVLKYPTVRFLEDTVEKGIKTEDGFEIGTESGKHFRARKLVFATGIKDILPEIEGFAECWGITAVHCPYCHGYEVRELKTGILANGDGAHEMAKLLSNWTDDLTLLTHGKSELTDEQASELDQKNIPIVEKRIDSINHKDGYMDEVTFNDGSSLAIKALYSRVPFEQHSDMPKGFGCELNEQGYVTVDLFQKTSVPGIFACGDNSTFIRSVAQAVYAGGVAGAGANMEMIQEDWAIKS